MFINILTDLKKDDEYSENFNIEKIWENKKKAVTELENI